MSEASEQQAAARTHPKSWRPPAHAGVGRQFRQSCSPPPGGASAKKYWRRRRGLRRGLRRIWVRSLDHASSRRRRRRRFRRSHHRRLRRRFDENAAGRLRRGRLNRGLSRKRLLILGLAVGLERRKLSGIEERCRREAALLLPLRKRRPGRRIERSGLWSRVEIKRAETLLNFLLARRAEVQRPFGVSGRDAVFQRVVLGTSRLRPWRGFAARASARRSWRSPCWRSCSSPFARTRR